MATEHPGVRAGIGELPSTTEVLHAFRASRDRYRPEDVVLDAARRLARCHELRLRTQQAAHAPDVSDVRVAGCSQLLDDIDRDRAEQVARIDGWVAEHIAHRAGASLHTETLGAVIDRLAAKWVAAQQALGLPTDGVEPPPEPRTDIRPRRTTIGHHGVDGEARLHWVRLAELVDGYRDLITDVIERRRRLPVF
ncbi:DUF4254 domain-containing protein [Nocardia sp. alder85J]|uniref:DUF4254 domain-containing protein n=1 Tax=Nocardia sp. alder85J TaxID=2862949 RepID=UPI001CD81516|nr:DUF4254 domain-containing protein [Nocardia sp. alder85J]MCX4098132.1 DUF4254 domain-containing protein [Nocardia sp. alder85J]